MYKAIIVDDERIVLEGLKNTFKWEEYGFRVCGLAENGEEALNILETTSSNLVVTDIRMPDMDGL
ncbi:MAG TPA: response regulator, partial [Clostridiales bacterium]|nr:response regulator [Clostridiales bacterium]